MDQSGDKLDETGESAHVSLRPRALADHRLDPWKDAVSVARPQTITIGLRSEAIASHFAAREWRPASQSCRDFHHGLLVLGGEARLVAVGDPLQVLGPSF